MGMFDTVIFHCPECNGLIEEQSKAGPCTLKNYSSDAVAPEIARYMKGETVYCTTCHKRFKVKSSKIKKVKLTLKKVD